MRFRDFMSQESQGFFGASVPQMNPVGDIAKTLFQKQKSPTQISVARRSLKPARPAGIAGTSNLTIKSRI